MAENENGQEKTESPTTRRRQQARDEGQIARSAELSAAAVLLAGARLDRDRRRHLARHVCAPARLHDSAGSLSARSPDAGRRGHRRCARSSLGLIGALLPFVAGVVLVTVAREPDPVARRHVAGGR